MRRSFLKTTIKLPKRQLRKFKIDFIKMENIQNSGLCDKKKRILIHKFIKDMPNIEKLETLHKFYSTLPKQGSSEWLSARKVGASMAAAILGKNKYSSSSSAARELIGITKFTNSIKTEWGNLFEPAAKVFLEQYIKIYEFGSLPGFSNITSCSPDGVYIMTQEMAELLYTYQEIEIGSITLLEIKCPFNRYIRTIPEYYIPQLQLGMATLSITQTASFCEFAFRVCAVEDFNFEITYKQIEDQGQINRIPSVIGFIGFYNTGYIKMTPVLHLLRCAVAKILNINLFKDLSNSNLPELINSHKQYSLYFSKQIDFPENLEDFYQSELTKFGSVAALPYGILCYKLLHFKGELVVKEDYKKEIKLLVEFGENINEIKKKNPLTVENLKKIEFIIDSYCKSFDETVRNTLSI